MIYEFNHLVDNIDDILKTNRTIIYNNGLLGDFIVQQIIINSIKEKYNVQFDFLIEKNQTEIVKYFNKDSNIYNFSRTNLYDLDNKLLKTNKVLNFINANDILNTHRIISKTQFNVKAVVDNINFKPDEELIDKIYSIFKIPKDNCVIVSLDSKYNKTLRNDLNINIVKRLIKLGYFVVSVSPNTYIENNSFININYKLKPSSLLNFISSAKFLITVDTAPMHMAAYVKVPFCTFFLLDNYNSVLDYLFQSKWDRYHCNYLKDQNIAIECVDKFLKETFPC